MLEPFEVLAFCERRHGASCGGRPLKRKLWTVGYTGYTSEAFLGTLQEHGIECLLDIREIPISRKRGFSKSALSELLRAVGIEYRHFRVLGSPRRYRHELRRTGDYRRFFKKMASHLACAEAEKSIEVVASIARKQSSCLMCCCPDWQCCHRKCVVEAIRSFTFFNFAHIAHVDTLIHRRIAA